MKRESQSFGDGWNNLRGLSVLGIERTLNAWFCGVVFNEICVEHMGFLAFLVILMGLRIAEITYILLSFRFCLYTLRLCMGLKRSQFLLIQKFLMNKNSYFYFFFHVCNTWVDMCEF